MLCATTNRNVIHMKNERAMYKLGRNYAQYPNKKFNHRRKEDLFSSLNCDSHNFIVTDEKGHTSMKQRISQKTKEFFSIRKFLPSRIVSISNAICDVPFFAHTFIIFQ